MRIELKGNSVVNSMNIAMFGSAYEKMVKRNKEVVSAFKAVNSSTQMLAGGVGNLKTATDEISARVKTNDEKRVSKLENSGQRFAMFITNAMHTDKMVSEQLKLSNKEFYNENPWAVPPKPPGFWDKVKGFFKSVGSAIAGAVKKAVSWVADKIKKAWNATVKFIKEHYKTILKIVGATILIAGLFALSVVTGGAAAGVFALAAKAALTMALTSAATSVVSGIVEGKSAGEIFDDTGDSFFKGAVTGAISGAVSAVGPAVLTATGSAFFSKAAEILAGGAGDFLGGMITQGTDYLCEHGTLSGFFSGYLKEGGMNALKGMLGNAAGAVGGYLKDKGIDLLSSTFKGLGGGTLINSFKDTIKGFADKAPSWLIGEDGLFSSAGDLTKLTDPAGLLKEIGGKYIGTAFGGKLEDVSDIIAGGLADIGNALNIQDLISTGVTNISDKLGITDLASRVGDTADTIVGQLSDVISEAGWGGVTDKLGGFINNSINVADTIGKVCSGDFADVIGNCIMPAFKPGGSLTGSVNLGFGSLSVSAGQGGVNVSMNSNFRF